MRPVTRIHAASGIAAIVIISLFWTATVTSELALGWNAVVAVKTMVLAAIPILIAAMATAGLTGARLAGTSSASVIVRKRRRMMIIALNGLFVLVPSAVFLAWKAHAGFPDVGFYTMQVLELVAGAVNVSLLVANARDGRRMTAKRRQAHARPAAA